VLLLIQQSRLRVLSEKMSPPRMLAYAMLMRMDALDVYSGSDQARG
jgi:hypothetical protein